MYSGKPSIVPDQAKLFQGFADSSRLSILKTLRTGERTVGEIVLATSLSQSNISNHLTFLRNCGLVYAEKHGRYVRYRLRDRRIDNLLAIADELYADFAQDSVEYIDTSSKSK